MPHPPQLDALSKRLDEAEPRLAKLANYHAGRQPLGFSTEKYRSAFGGLLGGLVDNWLPLVVDAVAERLTVQGFRFGDEDADADAWAIWQANNLDAESQLAHQEALIFGRSYALVWADDQGRPRITVESARQVTVTHAAGDRRRRSAGLKRWLDDDGHARATLFLPTEVHRFKSARKVAGLGMGNDLISVPIDWDHLETLKNPLRVVPVVPLVNRPSILDGGAGTSEIEAVIGLQDALNKLLSDLLVASEFSAFRQKWATGPTDPETNQPVEPYSAAVTRLWVSEDDRTRFGSFESTGLDNYTGAIEALVQHVASQTRTPPHYLNPSADRLSGESIKAAETGLVSKVKRAQLSFGESWEEVERLGFAVLDDPRATVAAAETIWADPEVRTESEHVDATVKKLAVEVPVEQLWADLGYSPQQVEQFRTMRRRASLDTFDMSTLGGRDARN